MKQKLLMIMILVLIIAIGACTTPPPLPTKTAIPPSPIGISLTPSPTPPQTFGPGTRGPLCDAYEFVANVSHPDDTRVAAGSEFIVTWRIRNAGVCTWASGYRVTYSGYADKMQGVALPITSEVQPNKEVDVSVKFIAPTKPGVYVSAWAMANAGGILFFDIRGKPFYVKIIVY